MNIMKLNWSRNVETSKGIPLPSPNQFEILEELKYY